MNLFGVAKGEVAGARPGWGKVLVVDQERCDGCGKCVEVCARFHAGTPDPGRSRIRVLQFEDFELFVPSTCQHCETPFCTEACPTRACHRDERSRTVIIDREVCMGCKTCIVACPFGAPSFDEAEGISIKCDYCDGDPQCVAVCEPGALEYVYSDENNSRRRRRHGLKVFGWR